MLKFDGLRIRSLLPLAALLVLPCVVSAEMFHPAVPVRGIAGNVSVKTPGASTFERARDGRAQPFGSIIQTGNGASATLSLASDVSAKLNAASVVRVNLAGAQNERAVLSVLSGGASIEVKEGTMPANRAVELLWQGGTVVFPKEGEFDVDVTESGGSASLTMTVAEGAARIAGAGYSGVIAMEGAGVVLESNADLSHNRIQGTKESFVVSILTSQGAPRDITIDEDGQIKVYRKVLSGVSQVAVSVLEINPDGDIVKTESYTQFVGDARVRSLNVAAMAQEGAGVNLGDINE